MYRKCGLPYPQVNYKIVIIFVMYVPILVLIHPIIVFLIFRWYFISFADFILVISWQQLVNFHYFNFILLCKHTYGLVPGCNDHTAAKVSQNISLSGKLTDPVKTQHSGITSNRESLRVDVDIGPDCNRSTHLEGHSSLELDYIYCRYCGHYGTFYAFFARIFLLGMSWLVRLKIMVYSHYHRVVLQIPF
jgi:hypothetical protein